MEIDFDTCQIEISKHFRNKYMRMWNWDYIELRDSLKHAYRIDKVGNDKYEAYVRKKSGKKLIFVYYSVSKTVFIISGSEGDFYER